MAIAIARAKIRTEGEVERVYRQLREWLVTAQIPPGEFLSEAQLAQKCKTSRTPVREACSRLAQDKWLLLIPRKGYLVKPITVREIVERYEYRNCSNASQRKKSRRTPRRNRSRNSRASWPWNPAGCRI
jgi:DNA-binding GntR family transcriptional regulator